MKFYIIRYKTLPEFVVLNKLGKEIKFPYVKEINTELEENPNMNIGKFSKCLKGIYKKSPHLIEYINAHFPELFGSQLVVDYLRKIDTANIDYLNDISFSYSREYFDIEHTNLTDEVSEFI